MRLTLLEIKARLDDIRSDVALLNLAPLENKVEHVLQLFEGLIREVKENDEK